MNTLSEVWCAKCPAVATTEVVTSEGARSYCAAHAFAATSANFNGGAPRCGAFVWGNERCVRGANHDDPRLADPAPHMVRINRHYYLVINGKLQRTVR